MPTDTIQTEKFDASVARTWEATRRRETLLGAAGLMIWTGVFIALVVGTLVYDAGWIPEDYAVLTGEYGVFRGAKTKVYAAIVLVIIVMRWLRFRALVHDDARAERTANVAGIAFGALFLLALLAGLTALYGTFASPWLERIGYGPSLPTYGAVGLAVIAAAFGLSYLARLWGWRLIAEDELPGAVALGAIAILVGLPLAALFGFSAIFLAFMLLERSGFDIEPLRVFLLNDVSIVIIVAGFLLLSGIVHAIRSALRRGDERGPVFLATALATGMVVILAKLSLIVLLALIRVS